MDHIKRRRIKRVAKRIRAAWPIDYMNSREQQLGFMAWMETRTAKKIYQHMPPLWHKQWAGVVKTFKEENQ